MEQERKERLDKFKHLHSVPTTWKNQTLICRILKYTAAPNWLIWLWHDWNEKTKKINSKKKAKKGKGKNKKKSQSETDDNK